MSDIARLLRAAARLWEHFRDTGDASFVEAFPAPPGVGFDPFAGAAHTDAAHGHAAHTDADDADDGEEFEDWRRWYDAHRDNAGEVPQAIVNACLDDVREAGILHSVALLEIARKWGFDAHRA